MCPNVQDYTPTHPTFACNGKSRLKRPRLQVYRLSRRRCAEKEVEDMELKNLKLYLKNKGIMEENAKLRKRANLLYLENLGLMSEMKKKLLHSGSGHVSTLLNSPLEPMAEKILH
ncbi:PREDICTED: protein LITTLE ZIPPER 1-like [Tarenaya hassleriana]|uniref:protein LITTLE ZIPPER 1-like n=1 Tax=Tarenaya hassleriana TaxID=28532 RepID=UPI00053CA08E|nr:PREDICTED: protein LITTLE ZIPPER 1-like [Tarenaya hassleriana]